MSYRGPVLENYSAEARRAVSLATAEARRLAHPRVGTEHLLLGLLAADGDATAHTLSTAGATLAAARHKVAEAAGSESGEMPAGEPTFTPRARRALERAGRFSRHSREAEVRTEHVLLGVLNVEGLACQVLRGLDVDLGRLRDALVERPTETAPDLDEPPAPRPTIRPRCAGCAAALDDTLIVTSMTGRREAGGMTPVEIVSCGACGTVIGAVLPHD